MGYRLNFEGQPEIGKFGILSNNYCIVASSASRKYVDVLEQVVDLPVIQTYINGSHTIGQYLVGNDFGVLISRYAEDSDVMHIRNSLPEEISVAVVPERQNSLGNIIACNNRHALVNMDVDVQTIDVIERVLGVEAIQTTLDDLELPGTYVAMNNTGMIISPSIDAGLAKSLAEQLGLLVIQGTVNRGSPMLGAGILTNDYVFLTGYKTTSIEMSVIESVLQCSNDTYKDVEQNVQKAWIDAIINN